MPRYIFMLIALFCLPLNTSAQFCTGTLGENIFFEGNFGAGTPNLLSPNPNIAPGYTYTFNVPPVDGQYVLTNNTASWPGLFSSWLAIGDNSADPNGYMMVVNASNAPGLFYEQTVSGLCENTLYEFSADIINLIRVGTPNHLDPDVSFLLNGTVMFSTGNLPKTDDWTTSGFTFTTVVGQQSVTLSLRNNAPGGNGNDLAIDNISFRACGPQTVVSPAASRINLCEDDSPVELQGLVIGNQYVNPAFQWQRSFNQGLTWVDIAGANANSYTPPPLTAGLYYYRFLVADGTANLASDKCRVNSNAKIINVPLTEITQADTTLCAGQTLMIGNTIYSESGIYMDTFTSFLGCDSILIIDLTVAISPAFTLDLLVTPSCPNLTNGSISIENVSGGTPPFNYTFAGIDFGTTTFFPDLAGGESYSVIIQDGGGCAIERSAFVENPAAFMADLLVTPSCPNLTNGSISIENVSGGTPPYNYIFAGIDFGTTTFFPDLAGGESYSVVIQDDLGCSTERSAFIEQPTDLLADLLVTPPCPNLANGSITVENVSGGTPPYNYTFAGINFGATTFFSDLAGRENYTVVIQDNAGCSIERSVFIEKPAEVILDLGEDHIIELGETVEISPLYNFLPFDFNWQTIAITPIDCLHFADCESLKFIPITSQQVRLDLFTSPGCAVSDSIFIEVIEVRKAWLPNAFSPDGDNINDFFTVFGETSNVEMVEEFKIFNRWGALIFESKNFPPNVRQNGWDGTYKGEPMPSGVYIYTATVRFADAQVLRYSGDVSILR